MRRLHEVRISPDGSRVAFVIETATDEYHSKDVAYTSLWVGATSSGEFQQYTSTPGSVSSPQWSPDSGSIAYLSKRPGTSENQLYQIDRDGTGRRQLTHQPSSLASFGWSPDGKKIAYLAPGAKVRHPQEQKRIDFGYDGFDVGRYEPVQRKQPNRIWTVAPETGQVESVDVGDIHVMALQWSPDGKRFLLTAADDPYLDTEQLHGRLVTVQSSGGTPKLYCATSGKLLGASWAPDGKSIAFIGSREEGTDFYPGGLFVCRGEGSGPEDVAEGSTFAPETFRWMPDSQSLLVSIAEGAHRSLGRISIRDRKVVRLTHPPLEVSHHSDYSISRAGERIVCVLSTSTRPPEVWTRAAGELAAADGLKQLTHLNPSLDARSFGEGEAVHWKAGDGWDISGVLIKPVGYPPGVHYPLIVQLHGSNGGDANDFHLQQHDWGQWLANHGYAVFMPNYRGSLMGNYQFRRGARGDYGGRDSTDILDGVDFLIQQGIADPARLGVGGISYGGYMTNWIVTRASRFKAPVSISGFSSWPSLHGAEEAAPESAVREQWGVSPYRNFELLWARSPIAFVEKVRTPTLIFMGEQDPVIRVTQGVDFFRGLQFFHVPSELIVYPREGHGLREPNHLRDYLQRTLKWFDEYVKPSSSGREN